MAWGGMHAGRWGPPSPPSPPSAPLPPSPLSPLPPPMPPLPPSPPHCRRLRGLSCPLPRASWGSSASTSTKWLVSRAEQHSAAQQCMSMTWDALSNARRWARQFKHYLLVQICDCLHSHICKRTDSGPRSLPQRSDDRLGGRPRQAADSDGCQWLQCGEQVRGETRSLANLGPHTSLPLNPTPSLPLLPHALLSLTLHSQPSLPHQPHAHTARTLHLTPSLPLQPHTHPTSHCSTTSVTSPSSSKRASPSTEAPSTWRGLPTAPASP